MNQESLTDTEKQLRNGAIPKRKSTSKHVFEDGCITNRESSFDERKEIDVQRYDVDASQRLDRINGLYKYGESLKPGEIITSSSIADSGVFIDVALSNKLEMESLPSPIVPHVHRLGSDEWNNNQETFVNPEYIKRRRRESGKEDLKIETSADFCGYGYLTRDTTLIGFRKDSRRSEDKMGASQRCGVQVGYGSFGEEVRSRESTKRGRSKDIDSGEIFKTESRIKVERRHREEEDEGGIGDGVRRAIRPETPGQPDGTPRGQPRSQSGRIRMDHDGSRTRSDSSGSLKRHQSRVETQATTDGIMKKWPPFLWIMFKFLGLFWARPVIKERYCHQCYRKKQEEEQVIMIYLVSGDCVKYKYKMSSTSTKNTIAMTFKK